MQKWQKMPVFGRKKHLFEPNCSLFAICHLFATLQSIDYQSVLQQWQIWQINQENFSSKLPPSRLARSAQLRHRRGRLVVVEGMVFCFVFMEVF